LLVQSSTARMSLQTSKVKSKSNCLKACCYSTTFICQCWRCWCWLMQVTNGPGGEKSAEEHEMPTQRAIEPTKVCCVFWIFTSGRPHVVCMCGLLIHMTVWAKPSCVSIGRTYNRLGQTRTDPKAPIKLGPIVQISMPNGTFAASRVIVIWVVTIQKPGNQVTNTAAHCKV